MNENLTHFNFLFMKQFVMTVICFRLKVESFLYCFANLEINSSAFRVEKELYKEKEKDEEEKQSYEKVIYLKNEQTDDYLMVSYHSNKCNLWVSFDFA